MRLVRKLNGREDNGREIDEGTDEELGGETRKKQQQE